MSYRELRRKINNDSQLNELRKLHRALRGGDRDDRHKVFQAMRDREEEIFQAHIVNDLNPAQWNLVNDNMKKDKQRVREQADCECNTSNHAHSINCPQHPVNLQPPVGYK